MTETDHPPSPCRRECRLGPIGDRCLGCGRTITEIRRWHDMSAAEKRVIIADLKNR